MSIQAVSQVLTHSRAKGTAKLALVVLANRINPETGVCWPSIRLIAQEVGVSERQVIYILRRLVAAGELVIHYQNGRSSLYSLPIVSEGVKQTSPLQSTSPLKPTSGGGEAHCTPGGEAHFTLNVSRNVRKPKRAPAPVFTSGKSLGEKDNPKSRHPAIITIREVTGRFPPKAAYDLVIQKLGDTPDTPRLREIFGLWCASGFKPTNLAGVLDWYIAGPPERARASPNNGAKKTRTLIDPYGNPQEVGA